ncbi:MAG: UDP-2,3-diacylglucosamine diphosphatase LpxI [Elusimicrobiota bacterium]|jgi:DUF1009 family protein|nr:UDP-2,3-diacylglucosamine diphosphatase LpxI [Elusimicrobiota bacterium]
MTTKTKNKLGIIAGEGKFPVLIAKGAKAKGWEVFVLGIKNNTDIEAITPYADKIIILKLGQLSSALKFLKENGVTKAVMAGRVEHINIFTIMPDLRAAKVLASMRDMRAQSILDAVLAEFKKEGVEFAPSSLFLEDCVPQNKDVLSSRQPTEEEKQNIELGLKISKTLAGLDVGLTSVICDKAVLAVEAMEGTDNCIKRGGEIYKASLSIKKSPIVIVKVARPKQDDRYDLPVIGKGTIRSMVEAGAQVLAFEAGKTVVLDLEEVVKLANKNNICLLAI